MRIVFLGCAMLLSICSLHTLYAQIEVPVRNASFEDIPRAGGQGGYRIPISEWWDCPHFPNHSPADIHAAGTKYWNVSTQPYHGLTFLGLVTRSDGSYECVFQQLSTPLEHGKSYGLFLFLCQDPMYLSPVKKDNPQLVTFDQPTIVRIWGSTKGEHALLAESDPVNHPDWQEYVLDFLPKRSYTHLFIEVYFANEAEPGPGHVLIDNAKLVKYD